ncbi:MAG TPA: hypothetical protein ENI57_04550 [Ignavibacteria bacterium]|nr:hypothetical protein [Ignavibacteria bacterium]
MKQLNLTFINDLNLQLRHNSWNFQVHDKPTFKPESKNKFITLAPGTGRKSKTKNNRKINISK